MLGKNLKKRWKIFFPKKNLSEISLQNGPSFFLDEMVLLYKFDHART